MDMSQFTATYAPQITSTYAPQISVQHAPQIILGSPYASMGYGAMQTPLVSVMPELTPRIEPIQSVPIAEAPISQSATADMGGGGGGLMDNAITIGVLAVGAFILYKVLMRPKSKKERR